MAVDYWHRLLVEGPVDEVRTFATRMRREHPRTVGCETWIEIVPFSFAALYDMAPAAARIEPNVPYDPYELSVWPLRRRDRKKGEIRYQFQTRNLEMVGLLRPLSRAVASLTFTLITLCLDDSSIESHRLSAGGVRSWALPDRQQNVHWERARRKFRLAGDKVFQDSEAKRWAEEEMLVQTLQHWRSPAGGRRCCRYDWWNRPRVRDLDSERMLALLEMDDVLDLKASHRQRRGRRRSRA